MSQLQPTQPAAFHDQAEGIKNIFRLGMSHRMEILGLTVIGALLAVLYASTQTPLYRATTTIIIQSKPNNAVPTENLYDPGYSRADYLATQVEVIRSKPLASRVVDKLELHYPLPLNALPNPVPEKQQPTPREEQPRDAAVNALQKSFSVEIVPRTQLVRIGSVSSSPDLAAKQANALADAYIEYGLDSKLSSTKKTTQWLTEKLVDIRNNLEKSERDLQDFREREKLVDVRGSRTLVEEEITDNSRRFRDAQKVRAELYSTYQKVLNAKGNYQELEQITELGNYPQVQSAKTSYIASKDALKELNERYGEKHPQIAAASTRLEVAEKTFHDQLSVAAKNIRSNYEIARSTERQMEVAMATAKLKVLNLDQKGSTLNVLEREADTNKQLYDLFLSSFKQTESSRSYEPSNVQVLEVALTPTQPFSPDISNLVKRGALAGFFIAIVLIFVKQKLSDATQSPEDIEQLTGLVILGVIPKIAIESKSSLAASYLTNPRSLLVESLRSVAVGLKLNDVDHRYKKLLMTSSIPNEGKSSLAACLSLSFSASEKVLLIEGDMHIPSLKKIFGLPDDKAGIMEYLVDGRPLRECIHQIDSTNLYLLPASKIPSNPAEVIASAGFSKMLEEVSAQYDRVIIDSPPAISSDTQVLSKMADAVLFAVKSDSTRRATITQSIKRLQQVGAPLAGVIVNQIPLGHATNYYDGYRELSEYYQS